MDKETLSNYGWIVICTLVLAVMIALATPFGEYVKLGVESASQGLYDVNNKALGVVYKDEQLIPGATFTDGTFLSWEELKIEYPKVTNTTIKHSAFRNDSTLKGITLPKGITSIENSSFYRCTSLEYINIPEGVTSIGENAFTSAGITSVTIPTSMTKIGPYAFNNCTKMTSVNIPNTVTSIGNCAFRNCNKLSAITFNGTISEWNTISKGSNWKYSVPATQVTCSDGTVAI